MSQRVPGFRKPKCPLYSHSSSAQSPRRRSVETGAGQFGRVRLPACIEKDLVIHGNATHLELENPVPGDRRAKNSLEGLTLRLTSLMVGMSGSRRLSLSRHPPVLSEPSQLAGWHPPSPV
jgi:hypothetical protein